MSEILGFDPLRDVPPPYWAAAGAAGFALLLGVLRWLKRLFFPKRSQPDRPRRSLANAVTWASAAAVLVFAGEGIFEVTSRLAPDVWWLPWLSIGLLEAPLLAFALRAKELITAQRREEAGQSIRLTWLFASLSALISASAALGTGDISLPLIRAAAPIVGVILWHHALNIELNEDGRRKRESRWKYTPEYILTRLGLVTARAAETADAEIHQRLTKVADWVIRYARNVQRNARRNPSWNTGWYEGRNSYLRWRMERVYRAAERDLDLTRNTDRRGLLEQIIKSRADAILLTTLAGVTRADLGLPEVEQPVEHPGRNKTITFQPKVERIRWNTRVVVRKVPVERPDRNARNNGGTPGRNGGGTPERNTRNGGETPERNARNTGGTPDRNKPTREEIYKAIAAVITPLGEVPIRPLAAQIGVPASTLSRHAEKFRQEHGYPKEEPPSTPGQGVIPSPRVNGQEPASVGGGQTR